MRRVLIPMNRRTHFPAVYCALFIAVAQSDTLIYLYMLADFGTLLGCIMGGVIGDRIGRLRTMIIGGLWVILGTALQCSAQNIAWSVHSSRLAALISFLALRMLCARVINGIGTGYLNAIGMHITIIYYAHV